MNGGRDTVLDKQVWRQDGLRIVQTDQSYVVQLDDGLEWSDASLEVLQFSTAAAIAAAYAKDGQ